MAKVVIRFVSSKFKIEEGALTLFSLGPELIPDLAEIGKAFSPFPLRSGIAETQVEKPGQFQGLLTDILLHRTADGTLARINLCFFNQEITDRAIRSGEFDVDLTSYKEVVLRLPGGEDVRNYEVFNIGVLEAGGSTLDVPVGERGETRLLAKPGRYRVIAGGKLRRTPVKDFDIPNDELESKIIDLG